MKVFKANILAAIPVRDFDVFMSLVGEESIQHKHNYHYQKDFALKDTSFSATQPLHSFIQSWIDQFMFFK
ncbi:MAG: hypothetical protein B0W54_18275 [Cellvibrio sp. 79]|nr:MAG: hypothetical protein B0W54_18275 [Cellvibrio sp. 79]